MNKPKMLDWDFTDLSTFVAVAEAGSFTRAAFRLGVTGSAVSRRIKHLEAKLGVDLLKRTTHSVTLTDAGRRLVDHAGRALGELEAAQGLVGNLVVEPVGTLRITASAAFAHAILSPLIARFLQRYPRINIVLDPSDSAAAAEGPVADIVIRTAHSPPPGGVSRRLASFEWLLVASARHLAETDAVESPRDLAGRRLITLGETWLHPRFRHRRTRALTNVESMSFVAVSSIEGALAMVRAHAGIGLAPGYLADPLLASGELQAVLPEWKLVHAPPGVVYASFRRSRLPAPKVSAFIDLVTAELGNRSTG